MSTPEADAAAPTTIPALTPPANPSPAARGALASALCYLLWGLVPLYWKQLADIHPVELIAHRHLWSLALVGIILLAQRRGNGVVSALNSFGAVGRNLLSGTLLTTNWLVYVWGVNTGHVIETSLGYFLVPLVNVAIGRLLLKEQLRRIQWLAIGMAGLGVALMIAQLNRPPWIALALAGSWSSYALLKKQSPLGPLIGLTVETLLLAPLAIAFLLWQHLGGAGALGRVSPAQHALVCSSGLITALPLLLFAYGARRIRLSTLGLLQYIAPTVQFILAVGYYRESFSRDRALGFGLIWAGLILYTADNLYSLRQSVRFNSPVTKGHKSVVVKISG